MKYALGFVLLAVASTPAFAVVSAPAPEIAAGLPAVIAVVGAYAATHFARRK